MFFSDFSREITEKALKWTKKVEKQLVKIHNRCTCLITLCFRCIHNPFRKHVSPLTNSKLLRLSFTLINTLLLTEVHNKLDYSRFSARSKANNTSFRQILIMPYKTSQGPVVVAWFVKELVHIQLNECLDKQWIQSHQSMVHQSLRDKNIL